jgi:hypothetical protein
MSSDQNNLPPELREVEDRLRASRANPTGEDLDRLRKRIGRSEGKRGFFPRLSLAYSGVFAVIAVVFAIAAGTQVVPKLSNPQLAAWPSPQAETGGKCPGGYTNTDGGYCYKTPVTDSKGKTSCSPSSDWLLVGNTCYPKPTDGNCPSGWHKEGNGANSYCKRT